MNYIQKTCLLLSIFSTPLDAENIDWEREKSKASFNYAKFAQKLSIESDKKADTLTGYLQRAVGASVLTASAISLVGARLIDRIVAEANARGQNPSLDSASFYSAFIMGLLVGGFLTIKSNSNLKQAKKKHEDRINQLSTTTSNYQALLQFIAQQESMPIKQAHEFKKMKASIKYCHAKNKLNIVCTHDKPQNTFATIQKGAGISMATAGTIFGLLSAVLKYTDLSDAPPEFVNDFSSPRTYLKIAGLLLSAGAGLYYNGHKQAKTAEHAYEQRIQTLAFDHLKYKQKFDAFKTQEQETN